MPKGAGAGCLKAAGSLALSEGLGEEDTGPAGFREAGGATRGGATPAVGYASRNSPNREHGVGCRADTAASVKKEDPLSRVRKVPVLSLAPSSATPAICTLYHLPGCKSAKRKKEGTPPGRWRVWRCSLPTSRSRSVHDTSELDKADNNT